MGAAPKATRAFRTELARLNRHPRFPEGKRLQVYSHPLLLERVDFDQGQTLFAIRIPHDRGVGAGVECRDDG